MYRIRKKYSPIALDIGHSAIRGLQLYRNGRQWHVYRALELTNTMFPSESVALSAALYSGQPDDALHGGLNNNDPWTNYNALSEQGEAIDNTAAEQYDNYIEQQIRKLMDRCNFYGKSVMLHYPAEKLDMRPISLPAGPDGLSREIIIGAIKMQTTGKLLFNQEDAVYDYLISEHDIERGKLSVIAFTADGQWAHRQVRILQKLKLQCVGIDVLPCVLSRVCNDTCSLNNSSDAAMPAQNLNIANTTNIAGLSDTANAKGEPITPQQYNADSNNIQKLTAVIDIGYKASRLVVCKGNIPILCRSFGFGGQTMTEIISQRLLIEHNMAEKLKLSYGLDNQTDASVYTAQSTSAIAVMKQTQRQGAIGRTIYDALQVALTDYTEGIIRTLNYAITENRNTVLARVLLCGRAAHTTNLAEYFNEQFGIPVEIISNSLLDEITEFLPSSRSNAGGWVTSLGLSLSGGIS